MAVENKGLGWSSRKRVRQASGILRLAVENKGG